MMRLRWLLVLVFGGLSSTASAQFGSFGDVPVEITADGETRFEGGVAVAEDNVQIHYQDISIYTDYAEYNPDTRDVLLIGDVRIYTADNLLTSQRALYNLESKQIRALEMTGESFPLKFRALSLQAPSLNQFNVTNATFTTDDSSQPDFRIKAKKVRIYPDSRVVFTDSVFYIGNVPVFYFPYLFAFTNNTGFTIRPGYDSRVGYYTLVGYSFPIGRSGAIIGTVNTDYRTELGFGVGFDADFKYGLDDRSYGTFRAYYANDIDPEDRVGGRGEPPEEGESDRYRISFQHRLFVTDDIYATADINALSDIDFLEDYYPNEFRTDPQPDNFLSLTKWNEFYTITLLTRFQVNDFYETTERLPELAIDFKQHQLFGLPIYYDGESSVGQYKRAFADGSIFPDYEATRFDTFHQISHARTYFGWLSVIPRMGIRGTYYSKTGRTVAVLSDQQQVQINNIRGRADSQRSLAAQTAAKLSEQEAALENSQNPVQRARLQQSIAALANSQQAQLATAQSLDTQASLIENGTDLRGRELQSGGATLRPVFNAGLEASFKLSKKYEAIQSRMLGLDGVLHTNQPYVNFSYVENLGDSRDQILQFDRVVPSTEPLPLDFPQFVAIDSIDDWSIVRLGSRNRFTTRRGDSNWEWFVIDSFFDINFNDPYLDNGAGDVSNVVNRIEFKPLPWASFRMDAQTPITDDGFTDINTSILFMPMRDLLLQFSNRYIEDNPFFQDSNQLSAYGYYQVNPHWGVSAQGTYEAEDNLLLFQRYSVHRDLSAWIMSFGGEVRENRGGDTEYGLVLTMSLKDAPQISLPLAYDPATTPLGGDGAQ